MKPAAGYEEGLILHCTKMETNTKARPTFSPSGEDIAQVEYLVARVILRYSDRSPLPQPAQTLLQSPQSLSFEVLTVRALHRGLLTRTTSQHCRVNRTRFTTLTKTLVLR